MAVSRARKNFRIILGILLVLSVSFFSTAAYFRIQTKQKNVDILAIAPTLFEIDIIQQRAIATFSNQDQQHKIAKNMIRQGVFSSIYTRAGKNMMQELAQDGHAPSQTAYGDILMRTFPMTEENKALAKNYFELAAAQGYAPAKNILSELNKSE